MAANMLKAIMNLDKIRNNHINDMYLSKISINNIGAGLEYYMKDLFCGTYEIEDVNEKEKRYSNYLSYLGNQNNPPDFIIENSDAVEVKKIGSQGSRIALNSSYPKHKLYREDPRITNACRTCESAEWEQKDIIYVIGVVKQEELKLLWFIYGDCYAASKEVYKKIYDNIKAAVHTEGYEFTETNELGKIKRIDPLGITDLRIRGMWHIDNPIKVYDYLDVKYNKANDLTVYAIMREDKYNAFPNEDQDNIEALSKQDESPINIENVEIKDPDNAANYINAKLIKGIYNDL